MDDNTTVSVSYEYINRLVKANEETVTEIEANPLILKQYEKEKAAFEQSKEFQDKLTAVLFDNLHLSARDEGEVRYLDVVNSRAIPYRYLRRAGETETPRLIKNLRRLQLTEYSEPASRKKYGKEIGFAIIWKDPNYEPTEAEKKTLDSYAGRIAEKFFFPAGETTPSLLKFLGECYENFFDFDDITLRIMRDGINQPTGARLEDPALWKPIIPKVLQYPRFDTDLIQPLDEQRGWEIEVPQYDYILMKDWKRIEAVTSDIVRKSHFFTRSDYQLWRRGYSIMEQAINVTSIVINAITYNASSFTTDRAPMGVLALTGGFTNQLLVEKLKKILWANMSSSGNKKRLPIIGLPENGDAKWVSMHANNKDMEFYTGLTFFISIICALSGTNPNELGIASFQDAMKGNRLGQENTDGVWKQSKDNGLKTFVSHIESMLNVPNTDGKNIFEEITKLPVRCEFKGLASEDAKLRQDLNKSRLETTASINDLLREEGKQPFESGIKVSDTDIFDIPAIQNTAILQFTRAQQQADQQAQMQQQQQNEQQQAVSGGQGGGEMTDADQKLIQQYGEPQGEATGEA